MGDDSQSQNKGIQKTMNRKERTVLLRARSDIVQNQTANSSGENDHNIANFNTERTGMPVACHRQRKKIYKNN